MKKKDAKRSAAGRKAILTMRRKAGDAYLSGLGQKAADTKRRNPKVKSPANAHPPERRRQAQ